MVKVSVGDVLSGLFLPPELAAPVIERFVEDLIERGYSLLSTKDLARSAVHFWSWSSGAGIALDAIDGAALQAFSEHHCVCNGDRPTRSRVSRRYMARVQRFVDHLQRPVGSEPGPQAPGLPAATPLAGFREWMLSHRGVVDVTIDRYERMVRRKILPVLGTDPSSYDVAGVRRAILDHTRGSSRAEAQALVTATRALLRFLATQGRCQPYLDRAVPTVPCWKLSALPRYLETDEVERVLSSCDSSRPRGQRDRAVLLLLARLGLRGADVVSMRMDDIDWSAATLRVHGKGRREARLPLPQDVGDAILAYLTDGRPDVAIDRIFLCVNAPYRPLAKTSTLCGIVDAALERANIAKPPSRGTNLLRHSAATGMLRAGATLETIATVLRHRSPQTTAHYAKVDTAMLEQIAQPWPEAAPC